MFRHMICPTALAWVTSCLIRLSYYCTSLILLQRNIAQQCAKYALAKNVAFHCQVLTCNLFIGPESDHWECLSVTHSLLTDCRLVNLIDVTLVFEDGNSKLVEVVTVVDVDSEDNVGNSLLQIWELTFGSKAKLLFRLWAQGLAKILKLKFRRDSET